MVCPLQYLIMQMYDGSFVEVDKVKMVSSEKLQRLGWSFRTLDETLIDSVESYREAGLLDGKDLKLCFA